jgi:hypothetical protein
VAAAGKAVAEAGVREEAESVASRCCASRRYRRNSNCSMIKSKPFENSRKNYAASAAQANRRPDASAVASEVRADVRAMVNEVRADAMIAGIATPRHGLAYRMPNSNAGSSLLFFFNKISGDSEIPKIYRTKNARK